MMNKFLAMTFFVGAVMASGCEEMGIAFWVLAGVSILSGLILGRRVYEESRKFNSDDDRLYFLP